MLRILKNKAVSTLLVLCLVTVATLTYSYATASNAVPASPTTSVTLTVSAAASLKDALLSLEKTYERQHPGIQLDFNLGASGALRKQIEEGAPADLFVSADTKNIEALDQKNLLDTSSKTVLLGNDLVLLANKSVAKKIHAPKDLMIKEVSYVGLGTPESVPAGAYGKEALTQMKLWDSLCKKLVFGKDVKQVMSYVETGNAQAGIVYASDAKLAKNSVVVLRFDDKTHSPIRYGAAVIKSSAHSKEAQAFLDFLASSEAQKIFRSYGFTSPK